MKLLIRLLAGITGAGVLVMGSYPANAQNTVDLPQMVIAAKRTEIITPPAGTSTPSIIDIKSSNPRVATAHLYRANQIQIVAVAPGKTTVEFFDVANRILYRKLVWVEKENATGGGGAGFDKTRTQLSQIVMLPKRTHNVDAPGTGPHQLSSPTS